MLFSKWNALALPTRITIAQAFGIAKTGATHVVNNAIQSDGYNFMEIERSITLPKLQEYLNSKETDFDILWVLLIDKTEGRESTTTPTIEVAPPVAEEKEEVKAPTKPKRKYTKRAK